MGPVFGYGVNSENVYLDRENRGLQGTYFSNKEIDPIFRCRRVPNCIFEAYKKLESSMDEGILKKFTDDFFLLREPKKIIVAP